jgi:hypothetical protein
VLSEFGRRIRNALTSRVDDVSGPGREPARGPRRRWVVPLIVVVLVGAVLFGTNRLLDSIRGDDAPEARASGTPTASASGPASPSPSPESPSPESPAPVVPPAAFTLGYQPLWPFAGYAAAEEWRTDGGSQPWHLDADQTALSFTRGYLGFTDITRVTSRAVESRDAHIGVGYPLPGGGAHTAAVLHLVRFGTDPRSPWEVVGSSDTTLSIQRPAYGSRVSSPLTVGGRITGTDESIRVWVRSLGAREPVGEECCLPAGGENSPWSQTVSFRGSGVLTLVASTGGHLRQVEEFAIHGVRT